jgi:hypothetical protein
MGTGNDGADRDDAGHDRDGLDAVRCTWGDAYRIGYDRQRGYWAARRDGAGGLIAGNSPADLSAAIASDFAMRAVPLPRDPALTGGAS